MKANRLSQESSPYLKQHAHNPVDWYPWGSEALDRARRDGKPIFLSIGYSACHWCHVMERESFEDASTAEILNREFISIKVDREERPDLDHIYMGAVQAITGHGGWPMSVFLTPDQKPFYGGTYFPPEDRHGMPSFKKILLGVAQAWKNRREEVLQNSQQLVQALGEMHTLPPLNGGDTLSFDTLDNAASAIARSFDSAFGGLGSSPKFFHTMAFRFALRQWKRTGDALALKMVTYTLDHISRGGIRDQLAGGFHRYSTDAQWLVPHFEKMLYDNALLTELFLEAYQATGEKEFASTARSTLDYLLSDLVSDEGLFYSTEDADSEGVEGKFYVWTLAEVQSVLGEELGNLFAQIYDVSAAGNWEHTNILQQKESLDAIAASAGQDKAWIEDQLATARRKLLQRRAERVRPGRDEKVLLSWNGLALTALAKGYQVLDEERYLAAARRTAEALWQHFQSPHPLPSGKLRLLHSYMAGATRFNGCLDDYAFYLQGLLDLYACDFDGRWIKKACEVATSLIEQFWSASEQVFYYTGQDHEALVTRPREYQDGATPAGQSIATTALLRLARLTENAEWEDTARAALQTAAPLLKQIPTGMAQMLTALQSALEPSEEAVLVAGSDAEEYASALQTLRTSFAPGRIVLGIDGKAAPEVAALADGKTALEGKATLYLCENRTCAAPVIGGEAIEKALRG
ncbi:thioredoxin domain-containing protein [bacterium]|nr:thioredoxin domain-containing protein [bacterium]